MAAVPGVLRLCFHYYTSVYCITNIDSSHGNLREVCGEMGEFTSIIIATIAFLPAARTACPPSSFFCISKLIDIFTRSRKYITGNGTLGVQTSFITLETK